MAQAAVTGFAEPFVDTRPFYRGTYFRVIGRTATGSGGGTSGVASGSAQIRLGQLTDFSFPFRNGGRFYLGVRAVLTVTATASGLGTASSSANVLRQRQGTGSGTGSETGIGVLVAVRTATGSGVGTMDSTGLHIAPRTATGSGAGSATVLGALIPVRTATGSGVGSGTAIDLVVNVRTATGSGDGAGTGVWLLVSLRTATGSGAGTETGVGARINRRTATGSGDGTGTADWDKSHIFRVPYTDTYGGGAFGMFDVENRLGSYYKTYTRGLNLYKLTNNEYTTVEQRDQGQVKKLWHGGRDHFLTDVEYAELVADGFGASIT